MEENGTKRGNKMKKGVYRIYHIGILAENVSTDS